MHVHRYVCIYIYPYILHIYTKYHMYTQILYIYAKTYTSITTNIIIYIHIIIYMCNFTCPLLCFQSLHKKRCLGTLEGWQDSQRLKRPARHGLGWASPTAKMKAARAEDRWFRGCSYNMKLYLPHFTTTL